MRRGAGRVVLLSIASALSGCSGVQSALSPSGVEALRIDPLFWTATGVSVAVTLMVVVLMALALYGPPRWRSWLGGDRVIIGGGVVLPIVVLTGLFIYGLFVMQAGAVRSAREGEATVTIIGKLWWWEVVYQGPDGEEIVSANELRLPAGRPVRLRLESDNVIHSFWAPQIAGKLDMIPGRTNEVVVEATAPGISRGQCAEYCGGAHALMAFYVVAMAPDEYDAWLAREAGPAPEPLTEGEARGRQVFLENGCGGCHQVRGTEARGRIGPDLTHVGSRMSLAAGMMPNDVDAFARWIVENQHIKPENKMPPFRQFGEEELTALAAYLDSLE
ncbi:cytochrome c oxidase subunit II [Chelativorans oligotrophicus]|jgi:cytochrome c oxidase subunit 2|uniref:Cytochrome c oxidase, subunit II n=1 Tax=Chelativorans sp. (strain BNC1) TaxID=266779 RepID=Q11EK7_CHESB|nr:c-type cytochrome [Chelativorans oligotrophicus]